MQRLYQPKQKKGANAWDLPPLKGPEDRSKLEGTLFGHRYLTVTIDEVHEMRNLGMKHFSALRVLLQGALRLALTATPLLTAPKVRHLPLSFPSTSLSAVHQDIASIGRLIGVPHFLTDDSTRELSEDNASIRKAKKVDDNGQALKKAEITAVRRMQVQFSGRILRRTTDSVDWRGKPLLDLPPHKAIIGVLELTGRELEIIQKRAEDARGRQVYYYSMPCHPWPSPSHLLPSAITANETGCFFQTRVRFVSLPLFPPS
jgi:TATA-binding protein-associated factor